MTNRPAEFDALVLQWMPFLHKMARRLERNAQDREDLINETVAVVLHRWASYREDGNFPGWLALSMRECVAALRRRQRRARENECSYDGALRLNFRGGDDDFNVAKCDMHGEPARQDNIVELTQVVEAIPAGRPRDILTRLACGDNGEEIGRDYGISRERVRQIGVAERGKLARRLGMRGLVDGR